MRALPIKISIVLLGLVVGSRADSKNHAEEGIDRRDRANNLFTVGEIPYASEGKVQGTERRKQVKGNPFENIIGLVVEFHNSFLLLVVHGCKKSLF